MQLFRLNQGLATEHALTDLANPRNQQAIPDEQQAVLVAYPYRTRVAQQSLGPGIFRVTASDVVQPSGVRRDPQGAVVDTTNRPYFSFRFATILHT